MNYFDMLLAKNLGGGGGGGGGSLEPFRGFVFEGQITTVLKNTLPESKGDFYIAPPVSADIEIDGVTYANVPCQYDPSDMFAFAWGAGEDEHGNVDFSVYPFRYVIIGTLDPVFYTQTAGTYDVKVTTVVNLSTAPVTFINQTEDEIWISASGYDAYLCLFPAESTTLLNIPLMGGASFSYDFSDGQITVSGAANWDSVNSVLQIFGPATVTISPW